MGNSFFLSSCGIVIFQILDGPVQGLEQVSLMILDNSVLQGFAFPRGWKLVVKSSGMGHES